VPRGELRGRVAIATLAHALLGQDKLLLVGPDDPDGDALAALLVLDAALCGLGKDCVVCCTGVQLDPELAQLFDPDRVSPTLPVDLAQRTALAVGCTQPSSLGAFADPLADKAELLLALDHRPASYADFAEASCIQDASSTSELVSELLTELGVTLDRDLAHTLYVGIAAATAQFTRDTVGAGTHRAAAACLAAGVLPGDLAPRISGFSLPLARLLARAVEQAELHAEGHLLVSELTPEDFTSCSAEGGLALARPVARELCRVIGPDLVALIVEAPGEAGRWVLLRSQLPVEQLNLHRLLAGLHPVGQPGGRAAYRCDAQPSEIVKALLVDRLLRLDATD
jgi:phosphoesterase RecJ-like protein